MPEYFAQVLILSAASSWIHSIAATKDTVHYSTQECRGRSPLPGFWAAHPEDAEARPEKPLFPLLPLAASHHITIVREQL